MKLSLKPIKNIFEIEELRNRILTTLLFIAIYRLGSFIVLPGVNTDTLSSGSGNDDNLLLGLLDSFTGGAFTNSAIFGLGIMPYISASIVVQLAQFAIPAVQKLQREGESGRKKINQITRLLTIVVCVLQSFGFITYITHTDGVLYSDVDPQFFTIQSVIILTAGTLFCMWMGEQITERGIGNGVSLLIMIGIIARFPTSILQHVATNGADGLILYLIEIIFFFAIVMGTVLIVQGVRKIPINYAKQVVNNKVYGGQRQYIPLKVNQAGVMPIIFAQAVMMLPTLLSRTDTTIGKFMQEYMSTPYTVGYNILLAVLIILFTFFYTAMIIQPNQIADDLKRNGGFIPGVKPGQPTANFIDTVLSRITFPGAVFIVIIAILPAIAKSFGIDGNLAYFFGGTSLLIMVGVVLDTVQQIQGYMLMKKYEGMMKSGKVKDTKSSAAVA